MYALARAAELIAPLTRGGAPLVLFYLSIRSGDGVFFHNVVTLVSEFSREMLPARACLASSCAQ